MSIVELSFIAIAAIGVLGVVGIVAIEDGFANVVEVGVVVFFVK